MADEIGRLNVILEASGADQVIREGDRVEASFKQNAASITISIEEMKAKLLELGIAYNAAGRAIDAQTGSFISYSAEAQAVNTVLAEMALSQAQNIALSNAAAAANARLATSMGVLSTYQADLAATSAAVAEARAAAGAKILADAEAQMVAEDALRRQRDTAIIAGEVERNAAAASLNAQRNAAYLVQERELTAAAISLQAQRNSAQVAIEQENLAAVASLQAQRNAAQVAEEVQRTESVIALQAQRNAAQVALEQENLAAVAALQAQRNAAEVAAEMERTAAVLSLQAQRNAAQLELERQALAPRVAAEAAVEAAMLRTATVEQARILANELFTASEVAAMHATAARAAAEAAAAIGAANAAILAAEANRLQEAATLAATRATIARGIADAAAAVRTTALGDATRYSAAQMLIWRAVARITGTTLGDIVPGMGAAGRELGYIASSAQAMGVALTSALGPVVIIGGAILTIGIASAGAAYGLVQMANSAGEFGEKLFVARAESGLTIDSILTIQSTTAAAGTTLEKLSQSLKMFQRRAIEAAEGGTSPLSKYLKALNFDTSDTNKMVAQFIDHLARFEPGAKRTAEALRIAGRSGEEWASITEIMIKGTGRTTGVFEAFRRQASDLGLTLSDESVDAARDYQIQLARLGQQFEVLKFEIYSSAFPIVIDWMEQISGAIIANRDDIIKFGQDFVAALAELAPRVETLLELIKDIGPAVLGLIDNFSDFSSKTIRELELVQHSIEGILYALELLTNELKEFIAENYGSEIATVVGLYTWATMDKPKDSSGTDAKKFFDDLTGSSYDPFGFNKNVNDAIKNAPKVEQPPLPKFPYKASGGGGGKGEDPARTQTKLAEIALRSTVNNLRAQEDALSFSLQRRTTSLEKFTAASIALEIKRTTATVGARSHIEGGKPVSGTGLLGELEQAEKIKKPGQRQVKEAEIQSRMNEERIRSAKAVREIIERLQQEDLEVDRTFEQTRLDIFEITGRQRLDRAQAEATEGLLLQKQVADQELALIRQTFDRKNTFLSSELSRAGDNKTERQRVLAEMAKLEVQYGADVEAAHRRIRVAISEDTEARLEHERVIAQIHNARVDILNETRDIELQIFNLAGVYSEAAIRQRAALEESAERERERRALDELDREKQLLQARAEAGVIHAQRAKEQIGAINDQIVSIHDNSNERIKLIHAKAGQDIIDQWKRVATDITEIITGFTSGGWEGAFSGLMSVLRGIEQELLQTALFKILSPHSPNQGSSAGGLVGLITNKILGAVGLGANEVKGPDAAILNNTSATAANTVAIQNLTTSFTSGLGPGGGSGGGINPAGIAHDLLHGIFGGITNLGGGSTFTQGGTGLVRPRRATTTTGQPASSTDITQATLSTAQALARQTSDRNKNSDAGISNIITQMHAVGSQIIQGLTPARQGFWAGILQAAVTGAFSGLGSGIGGSIGGGEGGEGTVTSTATPGGPETRPRRVGGMADGGSFGPDEVFKFNERGPEPMIYTGATSGHVVPFDEAFGGKHGAKNINVTINVNDRRSRVSYSNPKSNREMAESVASTLSRHLD